MVEIAPPEPGERCVVCNRRRNKKRTQNEPAETKQIRITLPADRAEWLENAIESLQEYIGADPESYPRGVTIERSVLFAIQKREELKADIQSGE